MTMPSRGESARGPPYAARSKAAMALAASISRRVTDMKSLARVASYRTRLRLQERLEFRVPRCSIRPFEHPGGLLVTGNGLRPGVPANLPAQAQGNVRQVTVRGDSMRTLQIGHRRPPRLNAIQKVSHVSH